MNSKAEVKRLLIESGHANLFNDQNYEMAKGIAKSAERHDPMLNQFFKNAEGFREKYVHDLIVLNEKVAKKNE